MCRFCLNFWPWVNGCGWDFACVMPVVMFLRTQRVTHLSHMNWFCWINDGDRHVHVCICHMTMPTGPSTLDWHPNSHTGLSQQTCPWVSTETHWVICMCTHVTWRCHFTGVVIHMFHHKCATPIVAERRVALQANPANIQWLFIQNCHDKWDSSWSDLVLGDIVG